MSNLILQISSVAVLSTALFLSNCSNDNHSVSPFDVTDLQAETELVGTWEAEGIYDNSRFSLSPLPHDSETTIIMKLNSDKTLEFTNLSGSIQEKGTWGTRSNQVLVINRLNDSLSTEYYATSTESGVGVLVYSLNFRRNNNEPFMIAFWTKTHE